jgi:hypothetical protein
MSVRFVFRIPALVLAVVMPALAGCGASEPTPEVYVLGHCASTRDIRLNDLEPCERYSGALSRAYTRDSTASVTATRSY